MTQVHFLYDAAKPIGSTDIWCSCHEHFGADEAAARAHIAGVTPGAIGYQDRARRLVADYHERLEHQLCGSLSDRDLWISEAAGLLEQIAGEQQDDAPAMIADLIQQEARGVRSVHEACPDKGTCHHGCDGGPCFRVRYCGPLSGVFPGNRWPAELLERNGAS